MYWILDDNSTPVKTESVFEWAQWFETADRRVALTELDGAEVSTVFLGLDHNYGMGPPLLYETMVFETEGSNFTLANSGPWRTSTREEALRVHQEVATSIEQELNSYHGYMAGLRKEETARAAKKMVSIADRKRKLIWQKKK
jgi:hypothetical protein